MTVPDMLAGLEQRVRAKQSARARTIITLNLKVHFSKRTSNEIVILV